jgi:hypothetical protein
MPSKFPLFDTSRLRLLPLNQRVHDLDAGIVAAPVKTPEVRAELRQVADRIRAARQAGAPVIVMMGAHVLRAGVQRYLMDLMERGLVTGLAGNGACAIHDFELALAGATTESVATYIRDGRFGMWNETSQLNDIARQAAAAGQGLGETLGQAIAQGGARFPRADVSLFAAAHRLGLPFTAHVGIGYDIVCEHPNYDGAAWGKASHTDFLIYANELEALEGGVVLSLGSAVMGPEVFLKALAMARNAAAAGGRKISRFTVLVSDLHALSTQPGVEARRGSAEYFFRPLKTMLVRTVAEGGEGVYVQGGHAQVVPELWTALTAGEETR